MVALRGPSRVRVDVGASLASRPRRWLHVAGAPDSQATARLTLKALRLGANRQCVRPQRFGLESTISLSVSTRTHAIRPRPGACASDPAGGTDAIRARVRTEWSIASRCIP